MTVEVHGPTLNETCLWVSAGRAKCVSQYGGGGGAVIRWRRHGYSASVLDLCFLSRSPPGQLKDRRLTPAAFKSLRLERPDWRCSKLWRGNQAPPAHRCTNGACCAMRIVNVQLLEGDVEHIEMPLRFGKQKSLFTTQNISFSCPVLLLSPPPPLPFVSSCVYGDRRRAEKP